MKTKSVLITGCSEGGLGSSLALSYHAKGHRVFATARSISKIQHLKARGLDILELEVTDVNSIRSCAEQVSRVTGGKLDILVNNAGIACLTPLLDVAIDDARKTFEANFFGVLSTIQVFAPLLIVAKGRIVNVSSVAQFTPVPWLGIYNCSKASLGMLSENLRQEMAPFGVKVICVITGGVATNIHSNQLCNPLPEGSVYGPARTEIEEIMAGSVAKRFLAPVNGVAEKIVRNSLSSWPSVRVFAGRMSTVMWILDVFGWHTIWDLIFHWLYGLWALSRYLDAAEKRSR